MTSGCRLQAQFLLQMSHFCMQIMEREINIIKSKTRNVHTSYDVKLFAVQLASQSVGAECRELNTARLSLFTQC